MAAPFQPTRHFRSDVQQASPQDWVCHKCCKLLGRRMDGRVQIQFARGHQYIVNAPASAVCRCCGTLNHLSEA